MFSSKCRSTGGASSERLHRIGSRPALSQVSAAHENSFDWSGNVDVQYMNRLRQRRFVPNAHIF